MSPPQASLAPPEFAEAFAWLRARLAACFEPQAEAPSLPFRAPAPLRALAERFSLDVFEQQLVLLCLFAETDTRLGEVFATGQHDGSKPFRTLGLAGLVLDAPNVAALAEDAPLRRWRLIETDTQEFCAFAARQLRLAPRILQALSAHGDVRRDLPVGLSKLEDAAPAPVGESLPEPLRIAFARQTVIVLPGADSAVSRRLALNLAALSGLDALHLHLEDLPETPQDATEYVASLEREARLAPFCLVLTALRREGATPGQMTTAIRIIERLPIPIVVDFELDRSLDARGVLRWETPEPDFTERRASWAEALGGDAGEAVEQLALTFRTSLAEIAAIGAACRSADLSEATSRAWEACRGLSRPTLDPLARRVVSHTKLTDLVLPEFQTQQLAAFVEDVRHARLVTQTWGFAELSRRGLGFSALFAGESGTGKTFAAEAIANELDFDLRRVDLASVVSKFIGETEKNLKALFDAAERGGVVLFFDESDALFGRRTEVKDSHDRYANIEINYLLQRMEDYAGVSILATNRRSAIDEAFLRRLAFVVEFPFPDRRQAKALWNKAFPAAAPTRDLDLDRLADLNLTGGQIRNVVLRAAFRAASAKAPIDTALVIRAAQDERRKSGGGD